MKLRSMEKSDRKISKSLSILAGLLALPACVMAQTLPCMPPSGYDTSGVYPAGSVNTISYYSSVAGANINMMVYTPPNYDPNKKYAVIYAYQGISTTIDTIFDDWCVDSGIVADNLIGQGTIQPVIIVALDDQFGGDVKSMTLNDAIPYVESHYSTYTDADHRGVYGFSWGGAYCFNIGCEDLDTFHHISPSSACTYILDGTDTLFPNGGAYAKQVLKTLLISCGDSDWDGFYPQNQSDAQWCLDNGIPNTYWLSVAGDQQGLQNLLG